MIVHPPWVTDRSDDMIDLKTHIQTLTTLRADIGDMQETIEDLQEEHPGLEAIADMIGDAFTKLNDAIKLLETFKP